MGKALQPVIDGWHDFSDSVSSLTTRANAAGSRFTGAVSRRYVQLSGAVFNAGDAVWAQAELTATVVNDHKSELFYFAIAWAAIVIGFGAIGGIRDIGALSFAALSHGFQTISIPWTIGIAVGLAAGFLTGFLFRKAYTFESVYEKGQRFYNRNNEATKWTMGLVAGALVLAVAGIAPSVISLGAGCLAGNYLGTAFCNKMDRLNNPDDYPEEELSKASTERRPLEPIELRGAEHLPPGAHVTVNVYNNQTGGSAVPQVFTIQRPPKQQT